MIEKGKFTVIANKFYDILDTEVDRIKSEQIDEVLYCKTSITDKHQME